MARPLMQIAPTLALVLAGCASGVPDGAREAPPVTTAATATTAPNPYSGLAADELDRALLAASAGGDVTKVGQLVDAGADTEVRDGRRRTPLLLAVTNDEVGVARVLVEAGADPDALDDRHDTPWLVTGVTGSVPMAKVILTAGPDLTIENRFGGLAHIPASERGHADYVEYVLQNTQIAVDHVNDLGWTALLEAVLLGEGTEPWQRIVRALVDAGADESIRDRKGLTALDHARSRGFTDIVRILEEG